MRNVAASWLATCVGCVLVASGCSGTTTPTEGTPFAQVFTGEMQAGGFAEYPIRVEGPGTLRVSLTAEGNDLFFLVTEENRPCLRNNCVPLVPMTAEHRLQYPVTGTQRLKLVVWHVLEVGEPRLYQLSAVFD